MKSGPGGRVPDLINHYPRPRRPGNKLPQTWGGVTKQPTAELSDTPQKFFMKIEVYLKIVWVKNWWCTYKRR